MKITSILLIATCSLFSFSSSLGVNQNRILANEDARKEVRAEPVLSELSKEQIERVNEIASDTISRYAYGNKYILSNSIEIRDFGNGTYVLCEFEPFGYAIYNIANGDMIEINPINESPFKNTEGDLYYVPAIGYYANNNGQTTDLLSKKVVSNKSIAALEIYSEEIMNRSLANIDSNNLAYVTTGRHATKRRIPNYYYPIQNGLLQADLEIPHSEYFKLADFEFAFETVGDGICGYVALGLYLSYFEIYVTRGYFSSSESSTYIIPYSGTTMNGNIPETINPFALYLYNLNPSELVWAPVINNTLQLFMTGKNIVYDISEGWWPFASTTASNLLENGSPAMLFGSMSYPVSVGETEPGVTINHAVVVYGKYESRKFLVHFGWNYFSQVILSDYVGGSTLGFFNQSTHLHGYYWKINNMWLYCGCGYRLRYFGGSGIQL